METKHLLLLSGWTDIQRQCRMRVTGVSFRSWIQTSCCQTTHVNASLRNQHPSRCFVDASCCVKQRMFKVRKFTQPVPVSVFVKRNQSCCCQTTHVKSQCFVDPELDALMPGAWRNKPPLFLSLSHPLKKSEGINLPPPRLSVGVWLWCAVYATSTSLGVCGSKMRKRGTTRLFQQPACFRANFWCPCEERSLATSSSLTTTHDMSSSTVVVVTPTPTSPHLHQNLRIVQPIPTSSRCNGSCLRLIHER